MRTYCTIIALALVLSAASPAQDIICISEGPAQRMPAGVYTGLYTDTVQRKSTDTDVTTPSGTQAAIQCNVSEDETLSFTIPFLGEKREFSLVRERGPLSSRLSWKQELPRDAMALAQATKFGEVYSIHFSYAEGKQFWSCNIFIGISGEKGQQSPGGDVQKAAPQE